MVRNENYQFFPFQSQTLDSDESSEGENDDEADAKSSKQTGSFCIFFTSDHYTLQSIHGQTFHGCTNQDIVVGLCSQLLKYEYNVGILAGIIRHVVFKCCTLLLIS